MKTLRRFLLPLSLFLFLAGLVPSRADQIEDWKAEIAALLPAGTHADKVRQFLRVRKFKITEAKKEKTLSGRIPLETPSGGKKDLTVVFQLDDAQLVKSVDFPTPPAVAK